MPEDHKSGVRAALEYTGIPRSWLSARPRLPSRNWLIFITFTSSVLSYYAYDRHQARTIRASYIDRVKHLSEEPMGSMELPRKVTVYGAKWPGDEDHQRAIKFFKKYVKPVLVAAAVDYELVPTRRLGDLTRLIITSVVNQRRISCGLDTHSKSPLPNAPTSEQNHARQVEGGVVLIGRHTLKEYLAGLKQGWSGGLETVDREERLAQELASDGTFDEVDEQPSAVMVNDLETEPTPTASRHPPLRNAALFSPFKLPSPPSLVNTNPSPMSPGANSAPPTTLPPHPPLLLVPFTNYVGFRYIPHMIWSFLNERHRVREGCEAALALIVGRTRDFGGPEVSLTDDGVTPIGQGVNLDETHSPEGLSKRSGGTRRTAHLLQGGDLDFMLSSERLMASHSPLGYISDARKSYYSSLPARIAIARQLARGERPATKEEEKNPPANEVELRAERLGKELRWRSEEEGWETIRPDSIVNWDERFSGVLKVFGILTDDDGPAEGDRVSKQ